MKKVIRKVLTEDNFLSLVGNAIIALLGVAGFALLARTYSLEIFGKWVLFITAGSFVEMFRFGVTNNGLIRYLSGVDQVQRAKYIGSNALISLAVTIFIAAILILCNIVFHEAIQNSGYELFFTWYPLLAFVNLPWNSSLVVLQADSKFGKILVLKSISSVSFFCVVAANYFFFEMTIVHFAWALLLINAATSMFTLLVGWDGFNCLLKASRETNKKLLDFGKYSTFTLIGSNLLRSADTFIISLSPLGNEAVALYSIPLKLTELQQIPLRSFVATAFPKMSRASMKGRITEVRALFYTYSGAISYLFIPISLCTFIFAENFVALLGGNQFLQNGFANDFDPASIVRVFSLYSLLLPIDRMTGIALDSINKPNINALKVFLMVFANIVGDLIAIFVFKSLVLVAVSSIFFTMVGIWLGVHFLRQEFSLRYMEIFTAGIKFYRSHLGRFSLKRQARA